MIAVSLGPLLADFVLDTSSPALFVLLLVVMFGSATLASRAARKRAEKTGITAPSASLGSRLLLYAGGVVILGIILAGPTSTATGRLVFVVVVLPLGVWAIVNDIWYERQRHVRGDTDESNRPDPM